MIQKIKFNRISLFEQKGIDMLAILMIEMEWYKKDRTPAGAVLRQQYYMPKKIDKNINLLGTGIFYKHCCYCQNGEMITSNEDSTEALTYKKHKREAFTGSDEKQMRLAMLGSQRRKKEQGFFYTIDQLNIPCLAISEEGKNSYRIKWYDNMQGKPRRKGGNEDFGKKGTRFAGQPNVLNETAFILEEGQSGLLKYNYRYTYYEGQWYKCYYIYMVNEIKLTYDIFLRTYDYEYNQLADLF